MRLQIHNPATDALLGELESDTPTSILAKFDQARIAQREWAARPFPERKQIIARFKTLVMAQANKLAKTLTSEVGKPIAQSRNEIAGLLGRIDFFLAETEALLGTKTVHTEDALSEQISHGPLGVVANISAWNYPYFVGGNVFVPALLTGNAVLYKPSELSSLTGLEIQRLLHEAGVPEHAFKAVIGDGHVGSALLDLPVDGVFFTGSHGTGVKIARKAAERLIKVQLELGGKDPVYVADDADVETAAPGIADGAFYNAGQSCCSVERIYVHAAIWEPFLKLFAETVRGFRLGDPTDPQTYIGPLARRSAQVDFLAAQVADAQEKGAQVLVGGKRADHAGHYFEPTVLINVSHDMSVMKDESFGPIIGLMKVQNDEEAQALMNDTAYGLTAAVYSKSEERARKLLSSLDVGSAYWNCCDRVSPRLPWSGHRNSGIGCTLSTYGIEAFLAPKAWHLRR
ncbi:MAG: aldehyde dehydrogenase family protein [Polyangiaceae bacterium]|nr:aldehyde dehydrogenase family protein [Polyangiaceae bacterium]